jgi:tetratricopeptide (TPR) repeat protein
MEKLEKLIQKKYDPAIPTNEALRYLASLINLSGDKRSERGIAHAIDWCGQLFKRNLSSPQTILLHYFRANAWAHKYKNHNDEALSWAWEHEAIQNEIVDLRSARLHPEFKKYDATGKCQILTNLAGLLSRIGRFVEASEVWRQVLEINPHFGMALGNLGVAQFRYAELLYEPHAIGLYVQAASKNLTAAMHPDAHFESKEYAAARKFFRSHLKRADAWLAEKKIHEKSLRRPKRSSKEKDYRLWCHERGLCLNSLNDLGGRPKILADDLLLPTFTTKLGDIPNVMRFFNQMKQEFVAARWFFYEGMEAQGVHFVDRDAMLYNTLDYAAFGIGVEEMKMAFRMAYSILDKIAFFLNSYFELGHDVNHISFRNVWREFPRDPKKLDLHPTFRTSKNWPLRGLYWLSKDIYEAKMTTMEPEARELANIRNHLEHKNFQVRELGPKPSDEAGFYSMVRPEFERMTIKIMRTARSALIYLCLAMLREEKQRTKKDGGSGLIMRMPLELLPDSRKQPL